MQQKTSANFQELYGTARLESSTPNTWREKALERKNSLQSFTTGAKMG